MPGSSTYAPTVAFSLLVDNEERAIKFYCETLGLFVFEDGILVFRENRSTQIFMFTAETDAMRSAVGRQAGDAELFVIDVADCAAVYNRLRNAGVRIDGEMVVTPFLRQLHFFDPFGNKIRLYEDVAGNWQRENPIEKR